MCDKTVSWMESEETSDVNTIWYWWYVTVTGQRACDEGKVKCNNGICVDQQLFCAGLIQCHDDTSIEHVCRMYWLIVYPNIIHSNSSITVRHSQSTGERCTNIASHSVSSVISKTRMYCDKTAEVGIVRVLPVSISVPRNLVFSLMTKVQGISLKCSVNLRPNLRRRLHV